MDEGNPRLAANTGPRTWGTRLAYQQMHVLGHDDISADPETILTTRLFQCLLDQPLGVRARQ